MEGSSSEDGSRKVPRKRACPETWKNHIYSSPAIKRSKTQVEQWIGILRTDGPMNTSLIEVTQETITRNILIKLGTPPKPIGRRDKKIKWAVTSYKIIQYSYNIIQALTYNQQYFKDTFHFKTKFLSQMDLLPAYQNEISIKQPKASNISKYIESISVEVIAVFQPIFNKYSSG